MAAIVVTSVNVNGRMRVGEYELLKNIGSGNTATVKLALQVETRKMVAIKIIDTNDFSKKKKKILLEEIKKEITITKMIKHPNVVDIIEVMDTKTEIYIVMEFVNGVELFHKISQTSERGMPELESRRYFHQLICAVDDFHKRGVSHGDLKPENLMVNTEGLLKPHKSVQSTARTLQSTARGTLQYTAPEVIRNSKNYNAAQADIWSCGIILFTMNAGYLPFRGDNNNHEATHKKMYHRDYTLPSFFSPGLSSLIQRILIYSPIERISINEIFQDEWFKLGFLPPEFPLDQDSKHLLADTPEVEPSGTQGPPTFAGYVNVTFKDEYRIVTAFTKDEITEAVKQYVSASGLIVTNKGYQMVINSQQAGLQGHLIIVIQIYLATSYPNHVDHPNHVLVIRKLAGDIGECLRLFNHLCTVLKALNHKREPMDMET